MKKELTFQELSPRAEKINKLNKKLDKLTQTLKEGNYSSQADMFKDLLTFEETEKEIQIQKSYMKKEEAYW